MLAEAERSAREPRLPDADMTDVPFVTLDPPESMDLDQAFHLGRRPQGGFRLRYAIADAAAFVTPGGEVDAEAHRRAETAYSPDGRVPLYPPVLSEGVASLLPDGPRPAVVWRVDVDATGATTDVDVRRAIVSSRAKLGYPEAQAAIDDGGADEMLLLLPEIGPCSSMPSTRGGASLGVPTQEVIERDGGYTLRFRRMLPVEDWNAQLSLLAGRAAAGLMLEAGVGIVRTMPPADEVDVARLRRVAEGLGLDWPTDLPYTEVLHSIDPSRTDAEAVFLQEAAALFRAASYVAFDGPPPPDPMHAAIAAPYAHCTAPLRRLVDRYANEVCLDLRGDRGPGVGARRPAGASDRDGAGRRARKRLERTVVDAVEAAVLAPLVGQVRRARDRPVEAGQGEVALRRPAVIGPCDDVHELGARVRVRLEEADVAKHAIRFATVPSSTD